MLTVTCWSFCWLVGTFCWLVGTFCWLVGSFCRLVGSFCWLVRSFVDLLDLLSTCRIFCRLFGSFCWIVGSFCRLVSTCNSRLSLKVQDKSRCPVRDTQQNGSFWQVDINMWQSTFFVFRYVDKKFAFVNEPLHLYTIHIHVYSSNHSYVWIIISINLSKFYENRIGL